MNRIVFASLVLLVAVVSCADESAIYEGHYSVGFEKSSFVPCGSPERWWVDGPGAASLAGSVHGGQSAQFYVRWRGSKSKTGHVGHLGKYDRVFTAESLIESHAPSAKDCK